MHTFALMPVLSPTAYVRAPDTGIDWVKDVWLGDFGGALLGAIVAVGVAIFIVRRDHAARLEDRRLALGAQFLDALHEVDRLLPTGSEAETRHAISNLAGAAARINGLYGNSWRHRGFTVWLSDTLSSFRAEWMNFSVHKSINSTKKDVHVDIVEETRMKIREVNDLAAQLMDIQENMMSWMAKPQRWKASNSYQKIWKQQRDQILGPIFDAEDSPDTPSPRPSE